MHEPTALDVEPIDLPLDTEPMTSPLSEYTALLLRAEERRCELEEERTRREHAEDTAWGDIAERLHEVMAGCARGASGTEIVERLDRHWDELGITFIELTGRSINEFRPEDVEVIATETAQDDADDGRIVQTFRPLILRRGRVIRTGRAVVLRTASKPRPEPRSEETS